MKGSKKQGPRKTCRYCKARFSDRTGRRIYCKPSCRWKAWNERHPRS